MTEKAKKLGNEFVEHKFLRQIGDSAYRLATPKDIEKGDYLVSHFGLTKREYFAGLAMQGFLSNSSFKETDVVCSDMAIQFSDALLEELSKTE